MIFNSILSIHQLFLVTLYAFFGIFLIRHAFIKRKLFIFLYHFILGSVLFFAAVVGGSVQNDGYARLKQVVELEKNQQLEYAKQHPQKYDSMLAIDIQEFENSDAFRKYLKDHDQVVDKAEAMSIGWLFVLLSDIAMLFVRLMHYGRRWRWSAPAFPKAE